MLPQNIQDTLRERFNPDGSDLRKHQLKLLEILIDFDKICSDNNIEYWLSAGNVLGAVRHGGFIPWDDDIDIEMTYASYRKLQSVFKESDKYVIQRRASDPYYALNYPKFRDKKSFLVEIGSSTEWQKYNGAFIDLFTMEETYACISHFLAWGAFTQLWLYERRNKLGLFAKPLCRIIGIGTSISTVVCRNVMKYFPGKKFRFSYGTQFHSTRREPSEIFPLGKVSFEGHLFPAPRDTDAYLRRIYGDYNQLPDLNNLHPHFNQYT